jgi:hypothetical protein
MDSAEHQARQRFYRMTLAESDAYRHGGPDAAQTRAAILFEHVGIGLPVAVLHPDGRPAFYLTAQDTARAPEPTRPLASPEGTLVEQTVVTAYRMSPEESYKWIQGDGATREVEDRIAERLDEAQAPRHVPVLLQDGRHAYTTGGERPLQTLLGAMSEVRERLLALRDALAQGVDITVSLRLPRQQEPGLGL